MLQKDHIDLFKPLKHSAYTATKEEKVSTGKGLEFLLQLEMLSYVS